LALRDLKDGARLKDLAEHQQAKVKELEARSEADVAIAIQQAFRHLFYPSQARLSGATVSLAHSALDTHSVSEKPGSGQQQVVRALRDYRKLRMPEDEPDAPAYVRDRTQLKKGQITTAALREEFRRDAALPILIGDDVFTKGIRKGVEAGEYVYRRGDLLYGPGDAYAAIQIDEQAAVFTMAFAKEQGIWPRPQPKTATQTDSGNGGSDFAPAGDGTASSAQEKQGASPTSGASTGGTSTPGGGSQSQSDGTSQKAAPIKAEGVLREALIRLWEQARGRKVARLGNLAIRVFDAQDGFRLLGVVAAVRVADGKKATITGSYETTGGSTLTVEFEGTPQDAAPLKDFLDPQIRAAAEKQVEVRFDLTFTEGLAMDGDAPEKLTEQLTRLATGAAYVEALAEAKS